MPAGVVVLSLLAVAGCAREEAGYTFALVPKAMNNPFFDFARDGCMQAAEDLDGVECLYIGPSEHTEADQIQVVEDLITRRVDGVAVSPSNAVAMARVLVRARDSGIPVITWDSDLLAEDAGLRTTYIGTENRAMGVEQAKLLQELKPEGGSICIQSGGAAAMNHNERMQGLRDTLAGVVSAAPPGERLEGRNGWTEVAACPLYTNDDFPLAVQQMADVLASEPDLDVFSITGGFPQFVDQAYRQAVEPYRERIESLDLVIIGADVLPMQLDLLVEGLSHGQVGQRPYAMGYRSMEVLLELVSGGSVEDPIYTGLDVLTSAEDVEAFRAR
ncbi:MAG: sugar ABC transporter substrate-binding protein [Holophagales bacterium]|nr:sugar ABC transporter substrate-binding protein [Holophagales bacterium]MXX60850.1 sugar ABC transporter substrate-binding protein [Holophagales bacterium]MYC10271.1 sugar ABC transporter substrate-binding protein [Holophagales bacterium]MYD22450.1 sugar ABC transporter substrate-binding protein [Holophagales bacterium]MYI34086.1 sugar ABC transporter substrate-binding protein [Holophagales bacterium]